MPKTTLPEPIDGLKFIDVHCHLGHMHSDKLPSDEQQYSDFFKNGGVYLITSSIDNNTLNKTIQFVRNREKMGYTCGWAPQTVTYTSPTQYDEEWIKWVDFIQTNDDFLAIGEIGLDFHHAKTLEKRNRQVSELRKIFEVSEDLQKPYVLHVRNAAEHEFDRANPKHRFNNRDGANKEILRLLKDFDIISSRVMWHCFSGPEEYGLSLSKQGYTLSVPSSAYGVNKWRRVTKSSSLNSLVTETDSYYQHPYLRGPVNVPSNVKYTIAAIAYTHNLSQQDVSKQTVSNAVKFFNLKI